MVKYRSIPVEMRASFFFILTGALKDALDVLTTPIFTRLLTLEEYGLFSVYNSWYQILRIVITIYLFGDGFSVGMAHYGEDKEGFTSSQQGLATVLFLIWGLLYMVGKKWADAVLGMGSTLTVLMLLQSLFTTPFNCWQQKEKYCYHYRTMTPIIIIYTILQPLLGIILIKLNKYGFHNGLIRLYSGVGVQIAFGLAAYFLQFVRKPVFYQREYWQFSIKTNVPLVPHYMSQVLLNQSDRLMINAIVGAAQTSIYSVAHAAAFMLHMVTANINSTFVPWLYENLKQKQIEDVRKTTSALSVLAAIAATVLVLIAPEAMRVLGGGKYSEGKWIIPPLTFSVYLIFIFSLFSDVELFFGKTLYVLLSSVAGAVCNIFLNYILIPHFGYLVAGYTTVAGYLLMCVCHYVFLRMTCKKENILLAKLFHIPLICLVAAILAILCGFIMLLYHAPLLRYGLFMGMITTIIWKRRSLMVLYHRLKKENDYCEDNS